MRLRRQYRIVIAVAILLVLGVVNGTSTIGALEVGAKQVKEGGHIFFMYPPLPDLLYTSFMNFTAVYVASFDTSMAHLTVVDIGFRDPLTQKISINRRILNADRDEVFISELALKVPENIMDSATCNTSLLKVDYDKISAVGQTLVAPPFLTGSLQSDPNSTADILVLGLGGSQLNNFIHHKFPHLNLTIIELEQSMVDIAKKYFGLQIDDTQRVLVMDGIKYLDDAIHQGLKFDAIYIDVCPTRFPFELTIMCPIPLLLDDHIIRQIRRCLKDTGTMISKMLIFSPRAELEAEKIADLYRKHFANCIVMPMPNIMNRVLVCSGEGIPKERFKMNQLSDDMVKFYENLGLRIWDLSA